MLRINTVSVLILIILALHATNVQALDLNKLKTAFGDFFDKIHEIIGFDETPVGVEEARAVYDNAANQATTYDALVDCGRTYYSVIGVYLGDDIIKEQRAILALRRSFGKAIMDATQGESAEKRLIPISDFVTLANNTATKLALRGSDGAERA